MHLVAARTSVRAALTPSAATKSMDGQFDLLIALDTEATAQRKVCAQGELLALRPVLGNGPWHSLLVPLAAQWILCKREL